MKHIYLKNIYIHIPALPNTCKISRIPDPHLNAPCAAYRCKQTDIQIPPLQIAKTTANTIGTILDDNVNGTAIKDAR